MNICYVAESYYPELDGGAIHSRMLAEQLHSGGNCVRVITRHNRPSYPRSEIVGGIQVVRMGLTDHYGIAARYLGMFSIIPPLVRNRNEYDIILVAAPRILGAPVVLLAKILGKKCILKPDSTGEIDGSYAYMHSKPGWILYHIARTYFWMRNLILRHADAFIAISGVIAEEISGLGVDGGRIYKIPNGVDIGRFTPVTGEQKTVIRDRLGLPVNATVFVYCGRLSQEKGLLSLLCAWKQLSNRFDSLYLLLVGSGDGMTLSCEKELKSFVKKNHLEKNVTFVGAVDDVRSYLHCSDAFILPSTRESFGVALIEAHACGIPAIGTRVGGIPEVIVDRVNGILVEPDNVTGLLDAATEMIKNRDMRKGYGEAARKLAVGRFSLTRVAEKYLDVMNAVIEAGINEPRG